MITFTTAQLIELISSFWWPFMRFTGFFMICPIFSDKTIPVQVRLSLAFLFGLITAPLIEQPLIINLISVQTLVSSFTQLLFGWILGLGSLLFFTAFTMAGQIISVQMGLAMAVMNDPVNGNAEAVIGRFFSLVSILLFLAFDAHLMLLAAVIDSFVYWPIDSVLNPLAIHELLKFLTWVISTSLTMAIPAIIVMLFSNIVFGFMTKAAPQLNIFALGFPMTMTLGLLAIGLSYTSIGEMFLTITMTFKDHLYYLMDL